jgi:hypothetical protein
MLSIPTHEASGYALKSDAASPRAEVRRPLNTACDDQENSD